MRELGADTVADFQTQRFEDEVRDVDAVLDLVGGETQKRSFQVLRQGGKLISAVSPPDQDLAKSHGVNAAFFLVNVTTRHLTEIADLIDRGDLRRRVGTVLSLADAREAHFILEGRRPPPKGKIVLALSSNSVVGQRMAVSLGVERSNRFVDGAVEVIRTVERLMSEVMPLQVAPETLDIVQLRSIFRQPLDGEPVGARGERGAACLAGV